MSFKSNERLHPESLARKPVSLDQETPGNSKFKVWVLKGKLNTDISINLDNNVFEQRFIQFFKRCFAKQNARFFWFSVETGAPSAKLS